MSSHRSLATRSWTRLARGCAGTIRSHLRDRRMQACAAVARYEFSGWAGQHGGLHGARIVLVDEETGEELVI
ncbi:hypothetical protein [Streptomyces sp. NPDC046978]|uniref:hypothetical protein n=1 Tax=unclassified Streptomyces TaxID=2593676 RepID=UPI0033C173E2